MKGLLLLIILLIPLQVSAKEVMIINYFDSYPPYSWNDGGVMKGILVEVAAEALNKRMGIDVVHQGFPWARAQQLVKHRRGDAFITVPTPERQEYTLISKETVLPVTFSLLVHKENTQLKKIQQIRQLSELEPYKLISYLGNGWAKKNLGEMDIYWVLTIERVLELMENNRYDVFVEATYAINSYIQRFDHHDKLLSIPVPFEPVRFHLCIGKNSAYTHLLPEFDATIREMRRDGTLEKIYQKYQNVALFN
ncbi:substrate-binding periplasmic protein [Psychromonas ossibalaenae]|uniref:substrate-binding periplasmic protein n=1 Tax=Psychromonas ossibalaenae TaxID=444922 RepID=UPI00037FAB14|nr:transporter substrate-binding domain-containing protein [Psychromonas ossibalaenae]